MNILFCGDAGVEQGIFLSALSICRHNPAMLHFYILTAGLPGHGAIGEPFRQALLSALRQAHTCVQVTLLDISDIFSRELPTANMGTHFTPLCMLRLFADAIPEIPDKILYLDADVLCRGDLTALYDRDLSGTEIAGVPDRYGKWFFGNIFRHDYLNSGVLLMNMAAIRQSGLFRKARQMCRDKKMFMPDQSALNKLAVKKKLPVRFNEQGRIRPETVLKHFTTYFRFFPYIHTVTVKPWQMESMHRVLGIYEFDDLLEQYQRSNQL